MAKARAIVKRRKAVRNIRKITKTMQMIATAKFQKSLKRAVGTKPYTLKVGQLVHEVASAVQDVQHPLLRRPEQTRNIALIVITSNRGLAGAYNGSVLRTANAFLREQSAAGTHVDLYVSGKKGFTYFTFQRRPIAQRFDQFADQPRYADVQQLADTFMEQFTSGRIDALYVAYMNFISTGMQRPEVLQVLPLAGIKEATNGLAQQVAEKDAQVAAGVANVQHRGQEVRFESHALDHQTIYEFSPAPRQLLDVLLPLTVRTALFQCFMDATTSENVARMVAMKSATDNADKMIRSLTMQYNRARQSQITTELSEIMGGVEAMKA